MNRIEKYLRCGRDERETIEQFANDHLDFLLEGAIDELKRRVEKFVKVKGIGWRSEIYEALLIKAIDAGEVNYLDFLLEEMYSVSILKEVDMDAVEDMEIPVIEKWYETELEDNIFTPFITENLEQLDVLFGWKQDTESKRVMWKDDEKLYLADVTPMAAALASGNRRLFEYILEKSGWNGFYGDLDSDFDWKFCDISKREVVDFLTREIKEKESCRICSPEVAALLSGNLVIIRKIFENQREGDLLRRLFGRALEFEGKFYYKEDFLNGFPDVAYWLNEDVSLYLDKNYFSLHRHYQLEKIINSANHVFLKTYLDEHDSIGVNTINILIDRVSTLDLPKMTFKMLEDKVKQTGVHCVPISEKWIENRKTLCIDVLKNYLVTQEAIVEKNDESICDELYKRFEETSHIAWGDWNTDDFTDESFLCDDSEEEWDCEEDDGNGWNSFQDLCE